MLAFNPESHTYEVDGVRYPNVTGVLKDSGLIDDQWFTEWNRKLGTYVHEATAMYDRGILDEESLDPAIKPYVEAWETFRRESGFTPSLIEHRIYHPIHCYAGTLDRIGTLINGMEYLVDIKTGQPQRWAALQTAAYLGCLDKPGAHRATVELRADGRYNLITHKNRTDWDVWLGVLNMYKWKQRRTT